MSAKRTKVTAEVVSVQELKTYLKLDYSQEDGLLAGMLIAAREWVEHYTATFWAKGEASINEDPQDGIIQLHRTGVNSIISGGGTLVEAPSGFQVIETTTAGARVLNIGTTDSPEDIKQAVKYLAGVMFATRGEGVPNYTPIRTMLMHRRKFFYV